MPSENPIAWPRLNMAAGPVEVPQRTLREASRPILYHYDPAFKDLFAHTTALAKQVFGTSYDLIIMQGEAILGLEAAAASLISPGDKVLNLVSGVFGKWFEDFIDRHGGETIELAVPYNEAIDPESVRAVLQSNPGHPLLLDGSLGNAVGNDQSGQGDRRRLSGVRRPDSSGRYGFRARLRTCHS
ncbi:MAG: hypothetical protein R2843_14130 [Thermomicrobiales bacterium]